MISRFIITKRYTIWISTNYKSESEYSGVRKYPAHRTGCEKYSQPGKWFRFYFFSNKNEKLLIRAIIEDRLEIILPLGHHLTRFDTIESRDLKNTAIIMHEKGSATERIFDDYIRKNNISVDILLELSSNNAVKLAVGEGLGIGVISRNIAIDEIKAGKLIAIPFSDPNMKHKYYMVHHKDKYISDILQHLIDTADQWAAEYKKSLA